MTPPSPQGAVQCASLVAVQGRQSAVIHPHTPTPPHHNNTTATLQDSGLVGIGRAVVAGQVSAAAAGGYSVSS